jgi:hypothetical protein
MGGLVLPTWDAEMTKSLTALQEQDKHMSSDLGIPKTMFLLPYHPVSRERNQMVPPGTIFGHLPYSKPCAFINVIQFDPHKRKKKRKKL